MKRDDDSEDKDNEEDYNFMYAEGERYFKGEPVLPKLVLQKIRVWASGQSFSIKRQTAFQKFQRTLNILLLYESVKIILLIRTQ